MRASLLGAMIVGCALAADAAAQRIDVADTDDFIPPSELGYAMRGLEGSPWFGGLVASVGVVDEYRVLGRAPAGTFVFTGISANAYRSRGQIGISLVRFDRVGAGVASAFQTSRGPDAPSWRIAADFARYMTAGSEAGDQWGRITGGLFMETWGSGRAEVGVSLDVEVEFEGLRLATGTGGLVIAYWPSQQDFFVGLGYDYRLFRLGNSAEVRLATGFGLYDPDAAEASPYIQGNQAKLGFRLIGSLPSDIDTTLSVLTTKEFLSSSGFGLQLGISFARPIAAGVT